MNGEILLTLGITGAAGALFVTGWLRMDLVALLVMVALAVSGLLSVTESLSGFSNPAVVTVWAVFILSAGLFRTGVASWIGRQLLRLAGPSLVRVAGVIMLAGGGLSAFMNNIGVAALLLPVVMDISRQTRLPASKLLMPMAFACVVGGLSTLIGTPSNLLVSEALRDHGQPPFLLFDFTPLGLLLLLGSMALILTVGLRLLPARDLQRETASGRAVDWQDLYALSERIFVVRVPPESELAGRSLSQSQLGSRFGLNVIGVLRAGRTEWAPDPVFVLEAADRLLVEGRLNRLAELEAAHPTLEVEGPAGRERLLSSGVRLFEIAPSPRSAVIGRTLRQVSFRERFGVNVLAIWRDGAPLHRNLRDLRLRPGDTLLALAPLPRLEELRASPDFLVSDADLADVYRLDELLTAVRVPQDSTLAGRTLAESRLAETLDLNVLAVVRGRRTHSMPGPEVRLQAGDVLIVEAAPGALRPPAATGGLELEEEIVDLRQLETAEVGVVEAVLAPHSHLAGRTLGEIGFREKFGLNVLAVWREGRARRTGLADLPLRLGDALLVHGPRRKLQLLGREQDFVVLAEEAQEPPRLEKARLAVLITLGVLLPVSLGLLPVAVATVLGAVLMVATGCLDMEEAYRAIDWKSVFLIAGILPLGLALDQSGAARLLASGVVGGTAGWGVPGVMAGLYVLIAGAGLLMPNKAVVVLIAPVALDTARTLGLSPQALMMLVAVAATSSAISPVAHPANLLVMGPGGYRFSDYLKVGLPLTLLGLLVVLLALPIFWPLEA